MVVPACDDAAPVLCRHRGGRRGKRGRGESGGDGGRRVDRFVLHVRQRPGIPVQLRDGQSGGNRARSETAEHPGSEGLRSVRATADGAGQGQRADRNRRNEGMAYAGAGDGYPDRLPAVLAVRTRGGSRKTGDLHSAGNPAAEKHGGSGDADGFHPLGQRKLPGGEILPGAVGSRRRQQNRSVH